MITMRTSIDASRFVHWGVIQISLANLLVIVAMVVLFIAAVAFQLPGARREEEGSPDDGR
jgi:hypothetical protein